MNDQEKNSQDPARLAQLAKIKQSRSRLMVCFLTLPLYIVLVWILLSNQVDDTVYLVIYIGIYAIAAIMMVNQICPDCKKQFFVSALWLNFFTSKCVHCGVSCKPQANDSAEM